jgi:hypothetical protein
MSAPDHVAARLWKALEESRAELAALHTLKSQVAALEDANARLHRQIRELEDRPAVRLALRAAGTLDRAPAVKRVLKALTGKLSR